VEQAPNKPSVGYLPLLWSQAFFQMSTNNILDAYGTELLGSCGDGKEVRCHDSRMRPSAARGKKRSSFILGKPFYWRIVPAVRSIILIGFPTCFRTSAGNYRDARLGCSDSLCSIPSAFDGGLFHKRYKQTKPCPGLFLFSNDHLSSSC